MDKVPFIDQSGLYTLEDIIAELEIKGTDVLIAGLREQPESLLRKLSIIPDMIPEDHLFYQLKDATKWISIHHQEKGN